MNISQDFEKVFYALSLERPKYLNKIQAGFYASKELDIMSMLAKKFYERFKETPSSSQMKLLVQNSKQAKNRIKDNIIDLVYNVELSEYDNEWLESTAEGWIRWRNFDRTLIDTVEYIKTTEITPETVESIITKAKILINDRNAISFTSDIGLDFFNFDNHNQKSEEKIASHYDFVNQALGGGFDKKSLIVYAGEQSIGKSIFLANDAGNFMRMGHNVAVITLEMSDHKFVKRIGANVLDITMAEYDTKSKNKKYMKRRLDRVTVGLVPPGELYIKQFPTSQATVNDLELHLTEIEENKGIKLSVIVIDYINILANYRNTNSENTYMKIKQIAEDLRAMAVRNDWLIITATQINRSGWDSSEISMGVIAESAGLAHTADAVFGIIQNDEMHADNTYWLKLLKVRDGEGKGLKFKLDIDYSHMRITETTQTSTSSIFTKQMTDDEKTR